VSGDICKSKTLNNVLVQENGIIRDSSGWIIGRLSFTATFDSLTNTKDAKIAELEKRVEQARSEALEEAAKVAYEFGISNLSWEGRSIAEQIIV